MNPTFLTAKQYATKYNIPVRTVRQRVQSNLVLDNCVKRVEVKKLLIMLLDKPNIFRNIKKHISK